METISIDTGDKPPILQNHYTLPLEHAAWVQKECQLLEKGWHNSVLLWASAKVVVPKKSQPGEPPRR